MAMSVFPAFSVPVWVWLVLLVCCVGAFVLHLFQALKVPPRYTYIIRLSITTCSVVCFVLLRRRAYKLHSISIFEAGVSIRQSIVNMTAPDSAPPVRASALKTSTLCQVLAQYLNDSSSCAITPRTFARAMEEQKSASWGPQNLHDERIFRLDVISTVILGFVAAAGWVTAIVNVVNLRRQRAPDRGSLFEHTIERFLLRPVFGAQIFAQGIIAGMELHRALVLLEPRNNQRGYLENVLEEFIREVREHPIPLRARDARNQRNILPLQERDLENGLEEVRAERIREYVLEEARRRVIDAVQNPRHRRARVARFMFELAFLGAIFGSYPAGEIPNVDRRSTVWIMSYKLHPSLGFKSGNQRIYLVPQERNLSATTASLDWNQLKLSIQVNERSKYQCYSASRCILTETQGEENASNIRVMFRSKSSVQDEDAELGFWSFALVRMLLQLPVCGILIRFARRMSTSCKMSFPWSTLNWTFSRISTPQMGCSTVRWFLSKHLQTALRRSLSTRRLLSTLRYVTTFR